MDDRSRHRWALLRNALTWGAAWGVAGGAIFTVLRLFNPGPGVESLVERLGVAVLSGLSWGFRFGIAGAVIGTIFSTIIRLAYRGRRLADINPVRFAMLGAVVGGVGVPLFLQLMNVLSGDGPIAWGLVTDDARWASVFGAAAAAGSILLARRADALSQGPHRDQLEHGARLGQPANQRTGENLDLAASVADFRVWYGDLKSGCSEYRAEVGCSNSDERGAPIPR